MAKYKKAVITNAGLDMLSRSILQSGAVTFTKMEIGAGEYQGDEDLLNSTGLKMPKQSCSITQATVVDGNTVKIQSRISNDEIKTGYYIREVGIYAQLADEEKLISINLAEPEYTDYLPDKDTAPVTVIYDIYLQIKNCNQINFKYTCPADVYALKADVDESLERLQKPIYDEAEDLIELTSGEEHTTAWGKVKKAIKELISHIGTDATANKGGHVRLSSSSAVTDSTGLALPATEKNASLDGTLAQQIAALNKSLLLKWIGQICYKAFNTYSLPVAMANYRTLNVIVIPDGNRAQCMELNIPTSFLNTAYQAFGMTRLVSNANPIIYSIQIGASSDTLTLESCKTYNLTTGTLIADLLDTTYVYVYGI